MNILITGATSGIGRGLALSYLADGHNVIAVGRNAIELDKLAELGIYPLQLDLVNLDQVREAYQKLSGEFGCIDIAILNAGNCEYVDVSKFDATLIHRVMDANFTSFVNSVELVLPLLRKSSIRHLVGVASIAGYLPLSRAEAYGASKAAVNFLIESLAIDLISEKFIVTAVNPGFVKTPLTAKNDFPMPFALSVEESVKVIRSGITKRKKEIHFPYRLTLIIKLFSLLPRVLWRKVAQLFKK